MLVTFDELQYLTEDLGVPWPNSAAYVIAFTASSYVTVQASRSTILIVQVQAILMDLMSNDSLFLPDTQSGKSVNQHRTTLHFAKLMIITNINFS